MLELASYEAETDSTAASTAAYVHCVGKAAGDGPTPYAFSHEANHLAARVFLGRSVQSTELAVVHLQHANAQHAVWS